MYGNPNLGWVHIRSMTKETPNSSNPHKLKAKFWTQEVYARVGSKVKGMNN